MYRKALMILLFVFLAVECLYPVAVGAGSQIVSITDLKGGSASGLARNDVSLHGDVCVGLEEAGRSYRVRLEGDGELGFVLTGSGTGSQLPYAVTWDSHSGGRESREAPGEFGTFDVSRQRCGSNSWVVGLEVRIARRDLEHANADHYRGRLVIEISLP